ncbi:hypothetical protein FQN51_003198 [Onygenales sp. PD_10]|nr:hypothetical protein FQN51_003198 [Onygenales sp. PD_10]
MVHLPHHHIQAILPSTLDRYETWVRKNGQRTNSIHDVETLEDGYTRGGYVMTLADGHLDVCLLEYELIPERPYPRQFPQAILAIQHLQANGRSLSNIIIGGDSAGGHLSLSIVSALMHPYPDSTNPLLKAKASDRLKGCFTVFPLLSYDCYTRSYGTHFSTDVLAPYTVREWGKLLVDNSPWKEEVSRGKGWGMSLDVPEEWWDNVNDAVEHMLVTGGQEEIFRDHIDKVIDILRRRIKGNNLVTYMAPDEAHDGPLFDFSVHRKPSKMSLLIVSWVISSFSESSK